MGWVTCEDRRDELQGRWSIVDKEKGAFKQLFSGALIDYRITIRGLFMSTLVLLMMMAQKLDIRVP